MAAASCLLSEDQFLCSVCLDVFTDPVSTPCGHNFCKSCITRNWMVNIPCQCPLCKRVFNTKPELHVNTFISEMVAQFQHEARQKTSSSSEQQAKPGDVACDVCTGTKARALKSCLVCLVSYCEPHLQPHLTVSALKRHQLIDPVENLEGRMCVKHDKPLELFCKTDQSCVCVLCSVSDHKTHEFVPLNEEYEGKKTELEETKAELQQMIQKRQLKVQELKCSVKISKENVKRTTPLCVQVFNELNECVRKCLEEFKTSKARQESTEDQAEDCIKELEQEISELRNRSSELEQLSRSEDHLHLLQSCSSLKAAPPTKDWAGVRVRPPFYERTLMESAVRLEKAVSQLVCVLLDAELNWVRQHSVALTLDADTAHPSLVLSGDAQQVSPGDVQNHLPENPERFSLNPCVLGETGFSSGRFYFEVQVKGKTAWDVGVARESINRKENVPLSPDDGYWTIWLRKRVKYKALDDPPVSLLLKSKPEKVGIFVDYDEGLVSFYDADAAALIYSFTGCCFTERLYPYFNPGLKDGGRNSAPLVLCPAP